MDQACTPLAKAVGRKLLRVRQHDTAQKDIETFGHVQCRAGCRNLSCWRWHDATRLQLRLQQS
jgi:hypothetical protein